MENEITFIVDVSNCIVLSWVSYCLRLNGGTRFVQPHYSRSGYQHSQSGRMSRPSVIAMGEGRSRVVI